MANTYDKKLDKSKAKLENLEKSLASGKKELLRLQNNLKSAKKRSNLALSKAKSSKNKAVQDRMKLTLKKEKDLERAISQQKQILKKLRETILTAKKDFADLGKKKKQYLKAMSNFENQWTNFYSKPSSNNGENLTTGSFDQSNFSDHIRATRALLNLSRNDFAKSMDITTELVKQIEQPSKKTIFEPHLVKSIYDKIKKAGVEVIPDGFYIGEGGIGVRLKRAPSNIKLTKPKLSKKRKTVTKLNSTNKGRPTTRKIAA